MNETFYKNILDSTWDWEYLIDAASHKLLYMSPSCKHHTGYSVEEFEQNFSLLDELVYTEDRDTWTKHLHQNQSVQESISHHILEYRIVTKDKTVKWIEHICRPFFDNNGLLIGRRISNRDITEQKEVQTAPYRRQKRYETELLNSLSELIWLKDESGIFLSCNTAFEKLIGKSIAEIGGKNYRVLSELNSFDALNELENEVARSSLAKTEYMELEYPDKSIIDAEVTNIPIFDEHRNFIGVVGVAKNITAQKQIEENLRQLAHFDGLTKLPNRVMLADRMQVALSQSKRAGEILAICVLDLDGFKPVNDTFGHRAGDIVLQEISKRLLHIIRANDTAARLGGDEFALLLGGLKSIQECEKVITRIIDEIALPIELSEGMAKVSASIGVTFFPMDGSDSDALIRHADMAMYQAKQSGKNRYCFFDNAHEQKMRANQSALKKIKKGLDNGEFCLYYQPKVDCRRGEVVGAEALIRWKHPIFGIIAPSQFLPLIENDELIVELGDFVIHEALKQMIEWKNSGLELSVSVNIAAKQLRRASFFDKMKAILDSQDYASSGVKLEIEIVETAALEDVNIVSELIQKSKEIGVSFSLDDFGTGYSSLVHLKHLNVDTLKIDQTFVHGMLDTPEDLAITEGIIGLCHAFERNVVAEGVESIEHILMLLEIGCDTMQGYGVSRPMPAEKIPEWTASFCIDPRWALASTPRPSKGGFHLLLAEANHRHWVSSVISTSKECDLTHRVTHLPPQKVNECRFGQWYYNDGAKKYANFPDFTALESLHESTHFHANEMIESARKDDTNSFVQNQEELLRVSSRLIATLHRLRNAINEEDSYKKTRSKR